MAGFACITNIGLCIPVSPCGMAGIPFTTPKSFDFRPVIRFPEPIQETIYQLNLMNMLNNFQRLIFASVLWSCSLVPSYAQTQQQQPVQGQAINTTAPYSPSHLSPILPPGGYLPPLQTQVQVSPQDQMPAQGYGQFQSLGQVQTQGQFQNQSQGLLPATKPSLDQLLNAVERAPGFPPAAQQQNAAPQQTAPQQMPPQENKSGFGHVLREIFGDPSGYSKGDGSVNAHRAENQASYAHEACSRSYYGNHDSRSEAADQAYYAAEEARHEADAAYAKIQAGGPNAQSYSDSARAYADRAQADADTARANADRTWK
jgi:hypothetical protein